MIIRGANIEEKNVEYKKLSDYDWTDNTKLIEIIKKLELLYLNIEKQLQEQIINQMDIEDGMVIIPEKALNHRCSNSLDSLREISNHALLASEWFGELDAFVPFFLE